MIKKTIKFSISMPAAEFRTLEVARRAQGRTRSQFIRELIRQSIRELIREPSFFPVRSIKEKRRDYGIDLNKIEKEFFEAGPDLTNEAEKRQRAIAAAGGFASGLHDLSINHDASFGGNPGESPSIETNSEQKDGLKKSRGKGE